MVAAMIVGRVTVSGIDAQDVPIGEHRIDPPLPREVGDEIGIFHLGSTAVVFLEAAQVPAGDIHRALGAIRVGDVLTRADESNGTASTEVKGSKEPTDG